MAKVTLPPTIHEYWPKYWARMVFFVIVMQIVVVLIVDTALLLTGAANSDAVTFWATSAALLFAVTGINLLVLAIASEPLKQLIAALAQAKGETSPLIPPNPNAQRHEQSGFKTILQTIFEFGAGEQTPSVPVAEQSAAPALDLASALGGSKAGIAIFDEHMSLLFANGAAPVHENPDGSKKLQLEFYTEQSLQDWVSQCEGNAVHAEKNWTRIASAPVGETHRRLFDITASYHKGSPTPVIVVLFEKTTEYAPEDDSLNFIAFAAHELRGPITVIRGYLDTLNDELSPTIDEEQKELFKRLIVSANRLSSYINNILNSSRYDRRHLSLHIAEMRVIDIYSIIADDMQLRASSQQRLLSVDLSPDLPTVAADLTSISEVIGNLIDNAIKYCNEGGVVEVMAEQRGNFVEISIRDHGIGMPPNVVNNLFHKFYRSHRSRETVAGTGIGLYISKAIVESHGGEMEVRSVENAGSTFSFTLPIYATVKDKIDATGGTNAQLITHHGSGSWIKNHGAIRG